MSSANVQIRLDNPILIPGLQQMSKTFYGMTFDTHLIHQLNNVQCYRPYWYRLIEEARKHFSHPPR